MTFFHSFSTSTAVYIFKFHFSLDIYDVTHHKLANGCCKFDRDTKNIKFAKWMPVAYMSTSKTTCPLHEWPISVCFMCLTGCLDGLSLFALCVSQAARMAYLCLLYVSHRLHGWPISVCFMCLTGCMDGLSLFALCVSQATWMAYLCLLYVSNRLWTSAPWFSGSYLLQTSLPRRVRTL